MQVMKIWVLLRYVVYEVKGSKKKNKKYVGKWSAEEIEYSCRKQQIEMTNT